MNDFTREMNTDLAGIAVLADAFADWADGVGLENEVVFQTNVVLDELITNVILYGLGEGQPGAIRVRVQAAADHLGVELRDNAPPFDPFSVPPPNLTGDIDERAIGGLGVHFVRSMMDHWDYVREADENVVRLRKNRPAGAS